MAEETIQAPTFDLGIESSGVYGNLKDAEAFLGGTESVTTDADDLEEIDDDTPPPPKKKEEKKVAPKPKVEEVDADELADKFLQGDEEDKDDDEEDEKKEEEKKTDKPEDKDDENQFETLSKELYKASVFTLEDGEEEVVAKTPEEFLDLFNKEKQKGASIWLENFLGKFGEDRRDLFDAIFVSGVEPKEYISIYNDIEDFEAMSLDSEPSQEKVVRTYYKRGGWSDEKIQAKIDKLKSYSDLEDEAKTLHPLIVEQDKQKLDNVRQEKEADLKRQEASDNAYKAGITKLLQDKIKEKNLNGLPIDEKKAKQAFDYMYTKKWKTPSGELLTDFDKLILDSRKPENLTQRALISLLALENWDFSKIEKKAISKESGTLFSTFAQKKEKKSNKQPVSNSSWATL